MFPLRYPLLVLGLSFFLFSVAAWFGRFNGKSKLRLEEGGHEEFMFVLGGTLTLLGRVMVFSS